MTPSPTRPLDTAQKIANACTAIERNLAAGHRIADLARANGMAPHHFQRRFAAATGETVAGYVRSRRLERAAIALAETDARILDIALDCGFETHPALTRAFSSHFGISPQRFRRQGLGADSWGLPPRPFLKPIESRSLAVSCDLAVLPHQWLCWQPAMGMVEGRFFPNVADTETAFRNLSEELGTVDASFASAYPHGPAAFEDAGAIAHFGAILDRKTPLAWSDNWTRIEGGLFAIFPHHGPLTTVHLTWHRAARVGLGRLGLKLRPDWMFEIYLTSRIDLPGDRLSALVHLPVRKSTIG